MGTESETTLTEVDYCLLMLFLGQFLLIGSFDDTGVPQAFFGLSMGKCADQMTEGACVYWFVMIVTILLNVASNVPVCHACCYVPICYTLRLVTSVILCNHRRKSNY